MTDMTDKQGDDAPRRLYCRCAYAKVVPQEVKDQVLQSLCESGVRFDAVADLCEMSARRDPALKQWAGAGRVMIAACFPRAVRGLFEAAGASLPTEGVEILNMRTEPADRIVPMLIQGRPMEMEPAVTAAVSTDEQAGE